MELTSQIFTGIFLCFIIAYGTIARASDTNEGAFFTGVQISDALSGTYNCTDPNHFFIISAGLFVPSGSSNPITLSIPESFGSLPNGSFPLKSKSAVVGTITNDGSNGFKVEFNDDIAQNTTTAFNFLTKLTTSAQNNITEPQTLNYTFHASAGQSYQSAINFMAKDISKLSSTGGIFAENNTAWFVADIPLTSLNQAMRFSAKPAMNPSFTFNTSSTTYEIVLKADALNRPLSSVPFTALVDQSDSSEISLYINTKIDGGKYLRVKYYSQPLSTNSIGTAISLTAASSENTRLSKRDGSSQYLTTTYYSGNETNIDSNGNDDDAEVSQQPSTNALYSNSTIASTASFNETYETYETYSYLPVTQSAVVTQIGTWVPITTLNESSTQVISSSQSAFMGAERSATITDSVLAPSNSSLRVAASTVSSSSLAAVTGLAFGNATSSNNGSSISSRLSETKNATSSSTMTISPSPVLSSALYPSSSTSHAEIGGYNDTDSYLTYSVVSTTLNGQLTTFTSWYAIATQSFASSYSNSSSSTRTAGATTTADDSYETYMLITKTSDGAETVFTSWFPIGTESTTSAAISATASLLPSHDEHSSTKVSSSSAFDDSYKTYKLVTQTNGGIETVFTSWYPVSTVSSASSTAPITSSFVASASEIATTGLSSSCSECYESYSIITQTSDGIEYLTTSWFPISTISTKYESASSVKSDSSDAIMKSLTVSRDETHFQTYSLTTMTRDGEETLSTNWIPVSTAASSTPTVKSQDSSLSGTIQTYYTSLTPQISAAGNSSSHSFTIYEGSGKRNSIGLGGIFAGLALLFF